LNINDWLCFYLNSQKDDTVSYSYNGNPNRMNPRLPVSAKRSDHQDDTDFKSLLDESGKFDYDFINFYDSIIINIIIIISGFYDE
jgi:hypothetical protein